MRSPGPIETPAEYLNIGTFRFWFVGERWEWSDEVARMHGYEPGDVEPTTQLLLSHKRPRRRARRPVHDAIVVADRTRQEVLDEALPDLFESRAAIEQAKGVLMSPSSIASSTSTRRCPRR